MGGAIPALSTSFAPGQNGICFGFGFLALILEPPLVTIPFRMRTYGKQPNKPFRIRTYKTQDLKPFRMNTYKKTGGEAPPRFSGHLAHWPS